MDMYIVKLNSNAEVVWAKSAVGNTDDDDSRNFAPGIYYVIISTKEKTTSSKLVIGKN